METIEKIQSYFKRNLWQKHDNPWKTINEDEYVHKYIPAQNCQMQLSLQYKMLTNTYDKALKRNTYENIYMLQEEPRAYCE